MQTESVTTPFGRRPMTIALVRRQQATKQIRAGKTADKWTVFRDASAAREALRIQSNSLAVLDALLSFYPENELREDAQLIVFPSNLQLSLRAHSMPGSTLRRHLAALVDAGLIVRRDSANGKRFSRKGDSGEVEQAFGFDLSPLLLRSEELAMLAQDVIAARTAHRKAKEKLTICRRDIRKLITAAIEEGAEGNWQTIEDTYVSLIARLPRNPSMSELTDILDEMEMLKAEILNLFEIKDNFENNSTNDACIERHIQTSKPESLIELEPGSEKDLGAKPRKTEALREPLKTFPLSVVLKACPQAADYAPGGKVSSWRELMSAAVVIRSMLGVSPSAYQDACNVMGPENAAVAMACILERANMINSAGAYLRDLTRRAERDEFSVGPMVMAALKANAQTDLRVG
ncbi:MULTISPECIES: plasmid replication protein RepC [Rhizobium]|uniref:plasmid replication protein RepC n=1 Tax=Rhizobium TaxID=379 RepID=UPI001C82F9DF|nr:MULTISPECIES: plasmid replication protein RepC [Rhizobium]MBX4899260.1 replication initiation protein RepC [Rhizobium bangladeshense]MBX5297437.1 replication initiation protein RepC [Rhizobium sp. NLR15a]MBY3617477.1 replication initiation protein RepC [Rhizobium bangladeshense]